jgi:hypothetical protein
MRGQAGAGTFEYDAVAVAAPASKAAAKAVQSKADAGNSSAPGNP